MSEEQLLREVMEHLYPLPRSVAGPGLRDSLSALAQYLPITSRHVATGTAVLDWEIPQEWCVRDAWIADSAGRRLVDFRRSNLHVVSHSRPLPRRLMGLADLRPHLHSLPERPDLVPYRTTFYADDWGFCLSQRTLDGMTDDVYEVCIDADLGPGHLSYGEFHFPGSTGQDFLLSAHLCHPSLANDNLSGVAVAVAAARRIAARGGIPRLGLRVLFAPGTIGTIAWLAREPAAAQSLAGGLSLVCLGDDRPLTYKRTIGGRAAIDTAAALVLASRGDGAATVPYHPWGYDERQYNSPAFRLPIGSLMRGRHGEYPEYHTSADDLAFVSDRRLAEAVDAVIAVYDVMDSDVVYRNLQPFGEPQLGRRGLYSRLGGLPHPAARSDAMLWILALADGVTPLRDIVTRSGLPADEICAAAASLAGAGLLERLR